MKTIVRITLASVALALLTTACTNNGYDEKETKRIQEQIKKNNDAFLRDKPADKDKP